MGDTLVSNHSNEVQHPPHALLDDPKAVRPAKEIEQQTNVTALETFQKIPSHADKLLTDYKGKQLPLRESYLLAALIHTLLSKEHERILGPYLMDTSQRSKEQSEDLANEQGSKRVALPQAFGSSLELIGALLAALKASSTAIPVVGPLIPAFIASGEVLMNSGRLVTAVGNVQKSYSEAEQTKLRHIYGWTEERLKEIERIKNQYGSEKIQGLHKLAEIETLYVRFVQELLSYR